MTPKGITYHMLNPYAALEKLTFSFAVVACQANKPSKQVVRWDMIIH